VIETSLGPQFAKIFESTRKLQFRDRPEYEMYHGLLNEAIREAASADTPFDWELYDPGMFPVLKELPSRFACVSGDLSEEEEERESLPASDDSVEETAESEGAALVPVEPEVPENLVDAECALVPVNAVVLENSIVRENAVVPENAVVTESLVPGEEAVASAAMTPGEAEEDAREAPESVPRHSHGRMKKRHKHTDDTEPVCQACAVA
jgi:hypothetical protein